MATLYVIGSPLDDRGPFSPEVLQLISRSDLTIAESPRVFWPRTKSIPRQTLEDRVLFLDPVESRAMAECRKRLLRLAPTSAHVVLLSDGGMPILFDPGAECLAESRKLKFKIRCVPSATSWGTACALSGYPPPYNILGFLPQKTEARTAAVDPGLLYGGNLVFLETPYRLLKLIGELRGIFGEAQEVFFAWQIAMEDEDFSWSTLGSLEEKLRRQQKNKGEFIVILKRRDRERNSQTPVPRNKRGRR